MRTLDRVVERAVLVVVIASTYVGSISSGQGFQRAIGTPDGERVHWVQETTDGGFIVVGQSGYNGGEAYVVKTDAGGVVQWQSMLGQAGVIDRGHRIIQTADGGYYIGAEALTGPAIDLIRLDAAGLHQWSRTFPGTPLEGETILDLAADAMGQGVIVGGRLQGTGDAAQAPVLVRVDASGAMAWAKYYIDTQFGVDSFMSFNDVHTVAAGYVTFGTTGAGPGGVPLPILAAFDTNGNPMWTRTYQEAGFQLVGFGLDVAGNGDYLLTCSYKGGGQDTGAYVMRVDSMGIPIWTRRARFFVPTESIEEDAGGGVIVPGTRSSDDTAALMLFDANGAFQWASVYTYGGLNQSTFGEAVAPVTGGGYLLAAWTQFMPNGFDYYLVRTDGAGVSGCLEEPWTPLVTASDPVTSSTTLSPHDLVDVFVPPTVQSVPLNTTEDDVCAACTPPPGCMVGWWPLDELSSLVSAELIYGNDGAHMNGPTPLSGELVQNALCFDGIDQYVEAPDLAAQDFDTDDFSIDAWVRTTNVDGVRVIVEKRSNPASPPGVIGYSMYLANGNLACQLADGNGSNFCSCDPTSACTNYVSGPLGFVADGSWHHVAVTVNRAVAGGGTFYVDGAPIGTFDPTCRTGTLGNDSPLRLGALTIAAGGFFEGCIDEVELFRRVLDPAEVQAIFDAGADGKCRDLCLADLTGDGVVDVLDLLAMLNQWGPCAGCCAADLTGDRVVDVLDLLALIAAWGPCP